MSRQPSDQNRRVFAQALKQVGLHWQTVLHDDEFHSPNYFDLFTEIWLKGGQPVCRTDCYRFMPGSPALKALLERNFDLTAQQLRQALIDPRDTAA
jgi:hypothetical protein